MSPETATIWIGDTPPSRGTLKATKTPRQRVNAPGPTPKELASMPDENTYGLCECGCGQPAPIARKTYTAKGHTKGQPIRFINGHQNRPDTPEYEVDDETGCWVWKRALGSDGYGRVRRPGQSGLAHRDYYEREHGPIPEGLQLDHLCRNPGCVNPEHLEAVSPAVNVQRSRNAKLDPARVREIRRLAGRVTRVELARRYGLGTTTIEKVIGRESWRNVA